MTSVLQLPARPGAPIACDMRGAPDSPDQRLAEYGDLFARALLRRERAVVFTLRADPGVREQVDDLARREAACCPFLGYRVETAGDEVRFTVTDPGRAGAEIILDGFYALPDRAAYCSSLTCSPQVTVLPPSSA
jgi:hypothetical protein